MTQIPISPAALTQELQALVAFYHNRCLLQAQAIEDLRTRIAELEAAIAPPADKNEVN